MDNELVVREYGQMTQMERADIAHQKQQRIIELRNGIDNNFFLIARELWEINHFKFYKDYGYDTFDDFIDQPELKTERAWAYVLMREFELYIIDLQIPTRRLLDVGISKLNDIAPYINAQNVDEMLTDAEHLSRKDLKIKLKGESPLTGGNERLIQPGYYRMVEVEGVDFQGVYLGKQSVSVVRTEIGVLIRID